MTVLTLHNIAKQYGSTLAVTHFTLSVADGEFVSLLGPSGCGKTTTLRMIAGFIPPTNGEIALGERVISAPAKKIFIPPEQRNMGMVFQSYAVWSHKNVFENVAYPLRLRRVKKNELQRRVDEALALVNLNGMGTRYPHQLSGGQQQRVALARALIMEPDVLLLDEPLSNLDAKLRERMRFEITELQKRVNITVVYVTHDQDEAMAMSDRIVVMNAGQIQQVDTPEAIYNRPCNAFVAQFVGTANLLPVEIAAQHGTHITVKLPIGATVNVKQRINSTTSSLQLLVRPEAFKLHANGSITGEVRSRVFLGNQVEYRVRCGEHMLRVQASRKAPYHVGDVVSLAIEDSYLIS